MVLPDPFGKNGSRARPTGLDQRSKIEAAKPEKHVSAGTPAGSAIILTSRRLNMEMCPNGGTTSRETDHLVAENRLEVVESVFFSKSALC